MKNTDLHGQARIREEGLIPVHGGYRNLKTFKLSELIYDVTVLFCDRFIEKRSRTHDQMVQAARSGRQNIAEGSMDSATSKKIEMKLTGIARGSLEELRLDCEDFLRQRSFPLLPFDHPALLRLKAMKCSTLEEFRGWVATEVKRMKEAEKQYVMGKEKNTDRHGLTQTGNRDHAPSDVRESQCKSVSYSPCQFEFCCSFEDLPAVLAANGALCLLNLCIYLLGRQLESLADSFEKNGGFTERLYRRRIDKRGSD